MFCSILHTLYGHDTRAAQVLNLVTALWWVAAVLATFSGFLLFDLPTMLNENLTSSLVINFLISLFATAGLLTEGHTRQVLKTFALVLGALWQAILANMYVSQYPPLSMMMCVSVVLSLWFVGAVIFIARCEGIKNGVVVRH